MKGAENEHSISQNRIFGHIHPLNGIFYASVAPWSTEDNTRDFLSQVWMVKTFSIRRARPWKGSKWQLLRQNRILGHFDPLNGIFHANFKPWPQEGNTRDLLSQILMVKIFSPRKGGLWKGPKWPFLVIFKPKTPILVPWTSYVPFLLLQRYFQVDRSILEKHLKHYHMPDAIHS